MRRNLIILFLGIGCLLIAVSISQAESINRLKCGTNIFPPYGIKKGQELVGIEIEILQEIGRRLNIDIDIKIFPWARLLVEMEKGNLDCMFGAFKTEDRLQFMDYTNVPIHVSSLVFYVHKERPIQYKMMDDLKGLKIGLVRGFKTSPAFDQYKEKKWFEIAETTEVDQSFKMLELKRVDAVLYNHHVGAYILKNLELDDIIALPTPLISRAAYITFSKKKKLSFLIPKLDGVLFEIFADGTYQNILRKYIK